MTGGMGTRNRREKSPAFTPPLRNFWDSSITQPRDQVPKYEHLSARRGAHGPTFDFGEEDGSLPVFPSPVFLDATCRDL